MPYEAILYGWLHISEVKNYNFCSFPTGCRKIEAAHRPLLGQRRAVLHGAVAPLRRPQLPQPEPLGHHPGVGQEGDLRL